MKLNVPLDLYKGQIIFYIQNEDVFEVMNETKCNNSGNIIPKGKFLTIKKANQDFVGANVILTDSYNKEYRLTDCNFINLRKVV